MSVIEEHFATALKAEAEFKAHLQGYLRGALTYAATVGQALEFAFQSVKRSGHITWNDAVDKYFHGARRSASDYRRVYRNWGKIKKAIDSGELGEPSIAAALEFLRVPTKDRKKDPPKDDSWADLQRDFLLNLVAVEYDLLDAVECGALIDLFEECSQAAKRIIRNKITFDDPYYFRNRDEWDLDWDTEMNAEERAERLHGQIALLGQRILKRVKVPNEPGDRRVKYELVDYEKWMAHANQSASTCGDK